MSLNCQEYAKFIKKWSRKNETTPHRKTRGSNINQAISMNTVFSFENYVFSFENYYINLCISIYCFCSGKDVPPLPPLLLKAMFVTNILTCSPNVVVYGASSPGILGTGSTPTWMDLLHFSVY